MDNMLTYVDMHTAGEPVRIITGGYPKLTGPTILDRRRQARETCDHLRRAAMLEPRGHAGMYGAIPVKASHPNASFGVLFIHNEGYSTMCGHATIALGRFAVDQGWVAKTEPVTHFVLEAPCGLLRLSVEVRDGKAQAVSFETVPAFAEICELTVDVPGFGRVICDIGYGGAYYAILPAIALGLDFFDTPVERLTRAAIALTNHLRRTQAIVHPEAADLGFLYGTIITDGAEHPAESYNLSVFAESQIDRSPTGSGVTARLAVDAAKGLVRVGESRIYRGISGEAFEGRLLRNMAFAGRPAVIVEVSGQAYYSGIGSLTVEAGDPFGHGFALPRRFADLPRRAAGRIEKRRESQCGA